MPWLSTTPPSMMPKRALISLAIAGCFDTWKSSGYIIGSKPLGKHDEHASASPGVIWHATLRPMLCFWLPKTPYLMRLPSVILPLVTRKRNGSELSKSVASAV